MVKLAEGKCPNIVFHCQIGESYPCSCGGYIVRQRGIFAQDSGLDSEGCLVECRRCHHIYFLFPPIKVRRVKDEPQT